MKESCDEAGWQDIGGGHCGRLRGVVNVVRGHGGGRGDEIFAGVAAWNSGTITALPDEHRHSTPSTSTWVGVHTM